MGAALRLSWLFCFYLFFSSLAYGEFYSNYEGHLGENHKHELAAKVDRYFFTDGELDTLKMMVRFGELEAKVEAIENSTYMNTIVRGIEEFNQERDELEKKGLKRIGKDRRELLALDEVKNGLSDLIANGDKYSEIELREKIANTSIYIALIDTILVENIFYNSKISLRNIIKWYPKISIEGKGPEASNLQIDGKFLTQDEIKELQNESVDISTINPPSSAFWKNNSVEGYDPKSETFLGKEIFPSADTPLYYKRAASGTIKFKAYWKKDDSKMSVTIRLGKEVHSGQLGNHLMRSVGFHAIPSVYRKKVKLYLGETNYDEFIVAWEKAHGLSVTNALSYITEYNESENYIVLKSVQLEGYPKRKHYRKVGIFRMGRNGFPNRREYRAQLIMNALLSLNDTNDRNVRADFFRAKKSEPWQPLLFTSDLGWTMGSYLLFDNMGAVNEYTSDISKRSKNKIKIKWLATGYNLDTFKSITYQDARWIVRRLLKISNDQLLEMALTSGFAEVVSRLYVIKIRKRINNLAIDFGLKDEITEDVSETYDDIRKDFPGYLRKNGKLNYKVEQIDSTNTSMVSYFTSPRELFSVYGVTTAIKALVEKPFGIRRDTMETNVAYDLGTAHFDQNLTIGRSRTVVINKNKKVGEQKRFLTKDRYTINIPIGLVNADVLGVKVDAEGPVFTFYKYTYDYYHSYDSVKDAHFSSFFKGMLPWHIREIRKKLDNGEVLKVSEEYGFGVGTFAARIGSLADLEVTPLGMEYLKLKETLISRNSGLLEIAINKSNFKQIRSRISLSSIIQLSAGAFKAKIKEDYKLYRVDLRNIESDEKVKELKDAFNLAVYYSEYEKLNALALKFNIKSNVVKSGHDFGFLVWSKSTRNTQAILEIKKFLDIGIDLEPNLNVESNQEVKVGERVEGNEESTDVTEAIVNNRTKETEYIIIAKKRKSTSRNFKGIYSKNINFASVIESTLNMAGQYLKAEKSRDINFEARVNADQTKFTDMRLVVDYDRVDNRASHREVKKDFIKYFNTRLGSSENEIKYELNSDIKHYSPVYGKMHWEFDEVAVVKIIDYIDANPRLCFRCSRLLRNIKKEIPSSKTVKEKLKLLKARAKNVVVIIRRFLSKKSGENMKKIRTLLDDQNMWAYAYISGLTSSEIPVLRNKQHRLFSKQIGHYLGATFLKNFKNENALSVNGDYDLMAVPEFLRFDYDKL
jgi:hypothetical protein